MTAHQTETDIMRAIQLEIGHGPVRLMRNNVGMLRDINGTPVRFGLGPGSSDLIGCKSVTITPDMVGQTIAQLVAIEVKTTTGATSTAQCQFIGMVRRMGGLAGIARSVVDAQFILAGEHV